MHVDARSQAPIACLTGMSLGASVRRDEGGASVSGILENSQYIPPCATQKRMGKLPMNNLTMISLNMIEFNDMRQYAEMDIRTLPEHKSHGLPLSASKRLCVFLPLSAPTSGPASASVSASALAPAVPGVVSIPTRT